MGTRFISLRSECKREKQNMLYIHWRVEQDMDMKNLVLALRSYLQNSVSTDLIHTRGSLFKFSWLIIRYVCAHVLSINTT